MSKQGQAGEEAPFGVGAAVDHEHLTEPVAEFCRSKPLAPSTFCHWLQKLSDTGEPMPEVLAPIP